MYIRLILFVSVYPGVTGDVQGFVATCFSFNCLKYFDRIVFSIILLVLF